MVKRVTLITARYFFLLVSTSVNVHTRSGSLGRGYLRHYRVTNGCAGLLFICQYLVTKLIMRIQSVWYYHAMGIKKYCAGGAL